jgi:sugar lactone lactonase YvrE
MGKYLNEPKPKTGNRFPIPFAFQIHRGFRLCGGVFLALAVLAADAARAQTTNYTLGTTALLEGPSAGSDSVVLAVTPATGGWTAMTNNTWLHLSLANQSGIGSTNVVFSFDANPGETRSGTLTIAGQMLTVTQAGSDYIATGAVVTIVNGLTGTVAVDAVRNVYIAGDGAISMWTPANNTVTTLISQASGLALYPNGIAVDIAGNVYYTTGNSVMEWTAANSNVTTLSSDGPLVGATNRTSGVAVDGASNVYFVRGDSLLEWTAATSNVTTLVASNLNGANGVALDTAGNVYIADTGNNAIKKWTAANNSVTLVCSNLNTPNAVAVHGAGNVYIADASPPENGNDGILEWMAATSNITTLVSTPDINGGIAVDGPGNAYIADTQNNSIQELPHAFMDPTGKLEGLAAGSDTLTAVLPASVNLLAPFAPTSDQSWLSITGISNGVVSFSFTSAVSNRTAHIALLGLTIPVRQGSAGYSLGTTTLLVGPTAGSSSVVLAVTPNFASWTASADAIWLHLSPANQSGTSSTNVVFTYDANPGATRIGTLSVAGQTLAVTQAGLTYTAAGTLTTLVSGGLLNQPQGVAVDGAGNVYVADSGRGEVRKWMPGEAITSPMALLGLLDYPQDVAVDSAGNVYVAATGNDAIEEWTALNSNVVTLVSSGLSDPVAVAVDEAGNVYIADAFNNAIKEWTEANSNVTTFAFSMLSEPDGVAVDGAGNIYVADYGHNALKEWTAINNDVTTLVASGLNGPSCVAVDGAGNVYIADTFDNAIKEWTAADNTLTTLVSSGLSEPQGVAVDGTGNVYIGDTLHEAIEELPYAFVDPTPKLEGLAAGNDSLPVVLPATENLLPPFAPTSDQAWLTITGVTNGVVSFAFTADPGPARTANITLLGQIIPITQGLIGTPPILNGAQMLSGGVLQFAFTNNPSGAFTVLSTTNLALPLSDWMVAGMASNTAPGVFQFTSAPTTNNAQCFYCVRSP